MKTLSFAIKIEHLITLPWNRDHRAVAWSIKQLEALRWRNSIFSLMINCILSNYKIITLRKKFLWYTIKTKTKFFELKKVLLIQKNVLWSKEIDLFKLKNIFLDDKTFFNPKKLFVALYIKEMFLSFKKSVFWV